MSQGLSAPNPSAAFQMSQPKKDVEFVGALAFCSNFCKCPCSYDGVVYPTSEHAFQAAKTLDKSIREQVRVMDVVEAKRFARTIPLRPNWNEIRVDVMEEILRSKFSNEKFKKMLIETGQKELIEVNYWGDTFWGQCPRGTGDNNLGKLLMKLRSEFIDGFVHELTIGQKLEKLKGAIEWLELKLLNEPYKDHVIGYIKNNSEGCW